MSSTVLTTTFSIGVAHGLYVVVALILRQSRNRRAAGFLMGLVSILTVMTAIELLHAAAGGQAASLTSYLQINAELAIGPLFLLFVVSVLDPDRRLRRRDALHLLPLAVGLAAWGSAWALVADRARPLGVELETAFVLFVALKACVFFSYATAAYRTLLRALRRPGGFADGRRRVFVDWLGRWIVGLSSAVGALYLVVFLEYWGVALPFGSDQLATLFATGVIYLASLMILLRPSVLALRPRPAEAQHAPDEVEKLTSYLESRKPWLDSELRLGDLAAALGLPENRLSTVMSEGLSTSFHDLVSRYRLAEFERLARDPRLRAVTVLELALRAGFNSKASFYRQFRQAHGTTPSAYRRILEESGSHRAR